jgi:protein-disulfide isomerase
MGLHYRSLLAGLALVAALWLYRHDRIAVQARVDSLLPYRALVRQVQKDSTFLVQAYEAQPAIPALANAAPGARAELVVFVDYECQPCFCKTGSLVAKLAETAGDRLAVTYRHYPLDASCNPAVKRSVHAHACAAAYAAEAARTLGGETAFTRMHEALFEHRQALDADQFTQLASSIGLDVDAFAEAMASEPVRQRVHADIALAREANVAGTPTLFLNGRKVPPLVDAPAFWEAIAIKTGLAGEPSVADLAALP